MADHSTQSLRHRGRCQHIKSGRGVVPHNIGFWLVTAAFVSLQAFGTVPTPMWPLYAVRDGLSSTTVTLAFACHGRRVPAPASTSSVISPTGWAGGGSSSPHSSLASRPLWSWRGGRPCPGYLSGGS